MPSAICPSCGRSVATCLDGSLKSHRINPGRYGRGPYCKASGLTLKEAEYEARPITKPRVGFYSSDYVAEGLGENIDHCPSDNG